MSSDHPCAIDASAFAREFLDCAAVAEHRAPHGDSAWTPLGAAAKTTGAGGGDIVLIAAPAAIDRNLLAAAIIQAGLSPLPLTLDPTGVDIRRPDA